jgi:hypothetical protein
MSKIDKYFLPDEINSVSELLASEDFKNFVKENPPSKAGAEALSVMNKSKDPDFLLLGEHRA